MRVIVLREVGYEEAALGFSLSYNSNPDRAKKIFTNYAWGIPGESKFLESIQLWLDVTAPRFWWQEADTYRVGSSKQSGSTMHTLMKQPLSQQNFHLPVPQGTLDRLNQLIDLYKQAPADEKYDWFIQLKNELPEGFLQRRIWNMNYKTLQNIYAQRYGHRLKLWQDFLDSLMSQIEHPEFVRKHE